MEELALHVLDLFRNSVEAGATWVGVDITCHPERDRIDIIVTDNGKGIPTEAQHRVLCPYYTTRKTRRVGLGLPLLQDSARASGGGVAVHSEPGKGTTVHAWFGLRHIDRPPLGDLAGTVAVIVASTPNVNLRLRYKWGTREFELDTAQIKAELGEVPITHPMVIQWLKDWIYKSISENNQGGELNIEVP